MGTRGAPHPLHLKANPSKAYIPVELLRILKFFKVRGLKLSFVEQFGPFTTPSTSSRQRCCFLLQNGPGNTPQCQNRNSSPPLACIGKGGHWLGNSTAAATRGRDCRLWHHTTADRPPWGRLGGGNPAHTSYSPRGDRSFSGHLNHWILAFFKQNPQFNGGCVTALPRLPAPQKWQKIPPPLQAVRESPTPQGGGWRDPFPSWWGGVQPSPNHFQEFWGRRCLRSNFSFGNLVLKEFFLENCHGGWGVDLRHTRHSCSLGGRESEVKSVTQMGGGGSGTP